MTQADPPHVAEAIAEMRRSWNMRLLMACLTMAAIVVFFTLDARGGDLAALVWGVAPWFVALALAFALATRWAIAREAKLIRERAAKSPVPR